MPPERAATTICSAGTQPSDALSGLGGNDRLDGRAGDDTLDGGSGSDVLVGGVGNDTYVVDTAADIVSEATGQGTADRVLASGSFTLGTGVDVEFLETTNAGGTKPINLTGNAIDNRITGNGGANVLSGGDGNDTLLGRSGRDILDGGRGADRMEGGSGNDIYFVDNARDVLVEVSGDDTVKSAVSWTLAKGFERLELIGSASINATGNSSFSIITGNSGKNKLDGGAGVDHLTGGKGRDILKGGTGFDFFYYNSTGESGKTAATRDVILDFKHGTDDIVLDAIDANGRAAGNQRFAFIGTAPFHHKAGELHYAKENHSGTANDKTIVSGDVNGDGKADFQIELTGLKTLTAGDFIL